MKAKQKTKTYNKTKRQIIIEKNNKIKFHTKTFNTKEIQHWKLWTEMEKMPFFTDFGLFLKFNADCGHNAIYIRYKCI